MATKEKDTVQDRCDSDMTWTLGSGELVQVRKEQQGRVRRKECVGRGAVIALLQEGALMGTEEQEPDRRAGSHHRGALSGI